MTAMRLLQIIFCLLLLGCAPPPARDGGFHSDDPASKLYAIVRAGSDADHDSIPHLIEQLDHDDPAVRMFAIVALERITGDRLGYNPYAPLHGRRAAVERWTEAYRRGGIPATE
ncbi:MAG: hypothetical protein CMJ18_02305 [Phycisphaeraceae bacterium]|nr:hypothetical protein [Phycisphaeraceae bacterium]